MFRKYKEKYHAKEAGEAALGDRRDSDFQQVLRSQDGWPDRQDAQANGERRPATGLQGREVYASLSLGLMLSYLGVRLN
jgi:hypothetical protein